MVASHNSSIQVVQTRLRMGSASILVVKSLDSETSTPDVQRLSIVAAG